MGFLSIESLQGELCWTKGLITFDNKHTFKMSIALSQD